MLVLLDHTHFLLKYCSTGVIKVNVTAWWSDMNCLIEISNLDRSNNDTECDTRMLYIQVTEMRERNRSRVMVQLVTATNSILLQTQ
jgi:hypothetical protein